MTGSGHPADPSSGPPATQSLKPDLLPPDPFTKGPAVFGAPGRGQGQDWAPVQGTGGREGLSENERVQGKVGTIVLCHSKWSSLGLAGVVLSHHSLLTQPLLTQPCRGMPGLPSLPPHLAKLLVNYQRTHLSPRAQGFKEPPRAALGPREVGTTRVDLSWQETKLAETPGVFLINQAVPPRRPWWARSGAVIAHVGAACSLLPSAESCQ